MELLDLTEIKNKFKPMSEVPSEYFNLLKEYAKNSSYYPRFHLAPPYGLMNDPNGLCQINGWYHIFYQWFPLGPVHGLKHWYHVKTRDFIHYVDLGPALYPDTELDHSGCYTGVAVKENGQWAIYYTGVTQNKAQQICRADFNGGDYIYKKQVCIPYNPALTTRHFRDPYLYKNYMVVGAQTREEEGKLAVFEKKEKGFNFKGFMEFPPELSGYMIECPNLISLNEHEDLLVFSPQGIKSPDRFSYRNVFSVVYGIGKFNPEHPDFQCCRYQEMDKGFDFYAPQIFQDEKGQHILLGWLGNSRCVYPSDAEQWAHMMTIPRKIEWEMGELRQIPVEELEGLRKETVVLEKEMDLHTDCFELEIMADSDFKICLLNETGEQLVFGGDNEEYYLDRSKTSHVYNELYGTIRYALRNKKRDQKIRIFVDRSAIEIFADDGFVVFTSRFYLDHLVALHCEGVHGRMYHLEGIEFI